MFISEHPVTRRIHHIYCYSFHSIFWSLFYRNISATVLDPIFCFFNILKIDSFPEDILGRPPKFEEISHFVLTLLNDFKKKVGDFFQILWPSHNI